MNPQPTYYFFGGLGDVVYRCFRYTGYENLLNEPEAQIVIGTVNPFVHELFRHTPNASGLTLVDVSNKYNQALQNRSEKVNKLFINPDDEQTNDKPRKRGDDYFPTFYAKDSLEHPNPYVVIQPFTGTLSRRLPIALVQTLVEACYSNGIQPFLVTRDYLRTGQHGLAHDKEELPRSLQNLQVSLSVPATLNLCLNAVGVVSTHSSLLHCGALGQVPTLAIQSPALRNQEKDWYFYYESLGNVTCLDHEAHFDARRWIASL